MDYNYWKNGAGKTTLLESMMQLVKYKGEMFYNEKLLKNQRRCTTYVSCIPKS